MNEDRARRTLVNRWMTLAHADLAYAQKSSKLGAEFNDKVCFHCQQAAEKALKALLTAFEVRPPKTHDLRALITAASQLVPSLLEALAAVADLTDYAVEIRYPDEWYTPDMAETRRALELARAAVETVDQELKRMAVDVPGSCT